jgi:hypothetical protein
MSEEEKKEGMEEGRKKVMSLTFHVPSPLEKQQILWRTLITLI